MGVRIGGGVLELGMSFKKIRDKILRFPSLNCQRETTAQKREIEVKDSNSAN